MRNPLLQTKFTQYILLQVTNILSNIPVFDAIPDSFNLAGTQKQIVEVSFNPKEATPYYGTLSILNNSTTPLVEVTCKGAGRWPLDIYESEPATKPYRILPNPVTDILTVELVLKKDADIAIDICELTGKEKIRVYATRLQKGSHRLDLSSHIRDLVSGICILNIRVGNTNYSEKLFVIR